MNNFLRVLTIVFLIGSFNPSEAQTPCFNGMADGYPCQGIDLLSHISAQDLLAEEHKGTWVNDIWGWTDPATNKEYALVGMTNGTSFVDVSDPINPLFLGILNEHNYAGKAGRQMHDGAKSVWRDIKVYNNHAFIVSEDEGHGMQVFDLTELRGITTPQTFTETANYSGISNAHNIAINEETGFAYVVGASIGDLTCNGAGLHIVDISTPSSPVYRACYDDDGYTHDAQCVIYNGPDTDYQGKEICFNSNEDTITLVDVDDKDNMIQISKTGYEGAQYTHQGWLTDDHKYFLSNDEQDEIVSDTHTKTFIWDVQDLENLELIGTYEHAGKAIDHNLYIIGDLAYEANYTSGLRVLDLTNIAQGILSETAYFDSYVSSDATEFDGAWSTYPFFESGNIIVSDITNGLFVLKMGQYGTITLQPKDTTACAGDHLDIPMAISGTGFTYQWQIDDGSGFKDIDDFERYKNTNTTVMHAHTLEPEQNGLKFRCKVTDLESNQFITDVATLTVITPPTSSFTYTIDSKVITFSNTSLRSDDYEWDFGDGTALSNEQNPIHEYASIGDYLVRLITTNKCGSDETTRNVSPTITGIIKNAFTNMSIYPTPTTGLLNIHLAKKASSAVKTSLTDLKGGTIRQQLIPRGNTHWMIDINDIPNGIYYLILSSNEGVITKKVIIN